MTLRVTLEIVPFGLEEQRHSIYRVNISNMGIVRNEGFGNEICKYRAVLEGSVLPTLRQNPDVEEWEVIDVDFIEEHNRRDGAVELARKACELMAERA